MSILKHTAFVLAFLFLFLGIPTLIYVDIPALFSGTVDAVSSASTVLPEQPSGEFVILLNTEKHRDTLDTIPQWKIFFSGEDAGVIMSDISCMVIEGDATGIQLAERFQLRLPENQMKIRHENGLLLSSKTVNGIFDVVILSREMADVYKISVDYKSGDIVCITVKGE